MEWLAVFVAGFLAAGVDGSLGMGFGPTASALLLASGMPPAATSAAVNVAKIGTGVAGGVAHWRVGNVDRRLAATVAIPGVVGAAIGVAVLAVVDGAALRPVIALVLLGVGLRVLLRTRRLGNDTGAARVRVHDGVDWTTAAVGGAGGCTNGLVGAWGPVVTPYLLHRGVPLHLAVGTVNTAEIAVALVSVGALLGVGAGHVDAGVAVAFLAGGVAAAPLAARLVRHVPPRLAGLALASLLLVTQARELATAFGVDHAHRVVDVAVMALVLASAAPRRRRRAGGPVPRPAARRSAGAPPTPTPAPTASTPAAPPTARAGARTVRGS